MAVPYLATLSLVLAAALPQPLAIAQLTGEASREVSVDSGRIVGRVVTVGREVVHVYRGIPFAAPPVGDLRWCPPQPAKPWEGVRECRAFAPACPQPSDLAYGFTYEDQSEDCLYLNVWSVARSANEKRPVMVWIHGGGNLIGGTAAPVYDGKNFAAAGVVLVSIQYRLGVFGYLAHPALTAEAKSRGEAASGNYGLRDLIAALHWIQRNIGHFGGDKDCVTVFGESAGAANVTHLMASPLAKGLFHRAIAQSGYFGENVPQLAKPGATGQSAHQTGLDFAMRMKVRGQDAAALSALRAMPAKDLLSVRFSIGNLFGGGQSEQSAMRFGPIVDGEVLPKDSSDVWAAGQMHRLPLIAGSLLDDGSVFSRASQIARRPGYRLALASIFGLDTPRALQVFPADRDEDVPQAVHRVITALAFRAPARRLVRSMDAAGEDAWLFHFTRNPGIPRSKQEGVFHGLEIPYVFGTLGAISTAADEKLSTAMLERWVNFARDGNPNGASGTLQPNWPKYQKASDEHLEFGDTIRPGIALDREACDLSDRATDRRSR